MAKGIASGLPLSAFTTRDEIAAAFQPGDHLSTFGGNPVSCAAALATIRYIEQRHLAQRAGELGTWARRRMESWRERLSFIGEVRGAGLMIGLELVADASKTPAATQAEAIKTACFERGVLVGVGGVHGNVIRIQPPLVITRQELDQALDVLHEALATAAGTRLGRTQCA